MKQPHTEQSVEHTETQQNTGNHKKPGMPDAKGPIGSAVPGQGQKMWRKRLISSLFKNSIESSWPGRAPAMTTIEQRLHPSC